MVQAKTNHCSARIKSCTIMPNTGSKEDHLNSQEIHHAFLPGFQSIISPEEWGALRQLFEWMSHGLVDDQAATVPTSPLPTQRV